MLLLSSALSSTKNPSLKDGTRGTSPRPRSTTDGPVLASEHEVLAHTEKVHDDDDDDDDSPPIFHQYGTGSSKVLGQLVLRQFVVFASRDLLCTSSAGSNTYRGWHEQAPKMMRCGCPGCPSVRGKRPAAERLPSASERRTPPPSPSLPLAPPVPDYSRLFSEFLHLQDEDEDFSSPGSLLLYPSFS